MIKRVNNKLIIFSVIAIFAIGFSGYGEANALSPTIVKQTILSNQNVNSTQTLIYTPSQTGNYLISAYAETTTNDTSDEGSGIHLYLDYADDITNDRQIPMITGFTMGWNDYGENTVFIHTLANNPIYLTPQSDDHISKGKYQVYIVIEKLF